MLGWLAFAVATVAWHVPALYELALHSHFWHHVQHLCFLSTGLLFWWPVLQPWPSRPRWPRWAMIPYLLLADIQNTALSAALVFSERILYPTYLTVPRLWGISALDDQTAAGVMMWVPGSLAYLVPSGVAGYAAPERTTDASPGHNASCPQDRLRLSHGCSSARATSSPRRRCRTGGSTQVRRRALVMEEHKALGPWHLRLYRSDTPLFET